MNYPIWEVGIGSGLVVAVVSIVHVFVSHFAVGGGLFLVVTEARCERRADRPLMEWLRRHSRFFVLLTVVFGAVTGVGIWFTIGVANPSATSSLIHTFVWGWAIEWVFFFLEITAALLYLYGWGRLDRRTHLWIGWIYFIAAYMSLVVINGIITYMLTPGRWIETRAFWDGFFNPTYAPSLVFRTGLSIALAGLYALLTAARQADRELKARIVSWSLRWILPGLVLAAASALWYVSALPDGVWAGAQGKMPTATRFRDLCLIFAGVTLVAALIAFAIRRRLPLAWSLVVLVGAFGTMGSFEFVRESLRKPYVIGNYLYANAVYKEAGPGSAIISPAEIERRGVLAMARWSRHDAVGPDNVLEAGREIFRLECMACHTMDGYRGLRPAIEAKGWDDKMIMSRLGALDKMHNRVMPPFVGTRAEREALAAYLAGSLPAAPTTPAEAALASGEAAGSPVPLDGDKLFVKHCNDCHESEPEDPLVVGVTGKPAVTIADMISRLPEINEEMEPFAGTDAEREALAAWLARQFGDATAGDDSSQGS